MGDDLCVAEVQEWADGLAELHRVESTFVVCEAVTT